jgi:hypothetical protein
MQRLIEHQRRMTEQYAQFWIPPVRPTDPAPPPEPEPTPPEPKPELTPIPVIKRRRCYRCGAPDAMARAKDEPAYCEEHRSKR